MCSQCDDTNHIQKTQDHPEFGRRSLLRMAGTGLLAAPLMGVLSSADAQASAARAATSEQDSSALGRTPFTVRAYGAQSAGSKLSPIQIQRPALGPRDILIDVLYAGICHSDIHQARNEWPKSNPTAYPCVPGREIVGRVLAVGNAVTKFKAGDAAGVGCMVNSCGECENCLADREQNCLKGTTFTYNSPDPVLGGHTYGGYSDKLVVTEHFAIRIPPGADLAAMAPLLCAGVTTFSPMRHWHLERGQRVGVVGLGGLGHMAVKLAAAQGAQVTVFTTSPGKLADAKRLGAREAVLWGDDAAMKRLAGSFDLLISTVPKGYPMQPFVNLLKLDATLVNVGALNDLMSLDGMALAFGRKSLAGSMIGGIAETQEVIDFCTARNIKADIELIQPAQINEAFERVVGKDVRYRFVIDFSSTRNAS